jgi:hypothetical protein
LRLPIEIALISFNSKNLSTLTGANTVKPTQYHKPKTQKNTHTKHHGDHMKNFIKVCILGITMGTSFIALADEYCLTRKLVTYQTQDERGLLACESNTQVLACSDGCRAKDNISTRITFSCRSSNGEVTEQKKMIEIPITCIPVY